MYKNSDKKIEKSNIKTKNNPELYLKIAINYLILPHNKFAGTATSNFLGYGYSCFFHAQYNH